MAWNTYALKLNISLSYPYNYGSYVLMIILSYIQNVTGWYIYRIYILKSMCLCIFIFTVYMYVCIHAVYAYCVGYIFSGMVRLRHGMFKKYLEDIKIFTNVPSR